MAKTHILAHDSEILTKGKTLDKKLKEIETKVDNIDVDGTLIATASKLGNVKIGNNIDVTNDGTISVKSIGKDNTTGIVTVDTLIQGTDASKFVGSTIGVPNQTGNQALQIRIATTTAHGVVKIGNGLKINSTTNAVDVDTTCNYVVDMKSQNLDSHTGEISGGSFLMNVETWMTTNKSFNITAVIKPDNSTILYLPVTGVSVEDTITAGSSGTTHSYHVILHFNQYYLSMSHNLLDLFVEIYGFDPRDYE